MTALDLSPAPGEAPLVSMVVAHARMELRLLMRNGEQVLLALVIPLIVLVGGAESGSVVDLGNGRRIDVLTPGVLALAVLSTSFTSLAISTGFERRYGVLKRLGSTPLPRSGLLLGKVCMVLAVQAAQITVIATTGLLLGWHPHGGLDGIAGSVVLVVAGTAALGSIGLLMAGSLPAEVTLAGSQLVYLVLVFAGATVVPQSSYPSAAQPLIAALPSGALAEGMRATLSGSGDLLPHLLVLLAWAAAGSFLTARTFKWE